MSSSRIISAALRHERPSSTSRILVELANHPRGRLDDPHAPVRAALEELSLLEPPQGFAQGGAADAVAAGEVRLGDGGAWRIDAVDDRRTDEAEQLLGDRRVLRLLPYDLHIVYNSIHARSDTQMRSRRQREKTLEPANSLSTMPAQADSFCPDRREARMARKDGEVRFVNASGGLGGGGLDPESLREGLSREPHFVGADAGTVDAGPYHLGSGTCAYSRDSVRYEVDVLLSEVPKGVPIVIGSVGTAGGDPHVDWMMDIVGDVIRDRKLERRVASIKSEQDPAYLKTMMRAGRVRPLDNAPAFDEGVIDRSTRIVGMMGVEPIQAALKDGADIVIAGRSSDSAVFAALPIMKGIPEGIAWHVGKVVECGTLACETMKRGTMFSQLDRDGAVITPLGEGLRCTPQSIAAHSLYENGDPYLHVECSGTLDLTHSTFEQVDDVSVRIAGAGFRHADAYSVKLEGVELVGYQSVIVGGVRDPLIIRQLDSWLEHVRQHIEKRVDIVLGKQLSPRLLADRHPRLRPQRGDGRAGAEALRAAARGRARDLPHRADAGPRLEARRSRAAAAAAHADPGMERRHHGLCLPVQPGFDRSRARLALVHEPRRPAGKAHGHVPDGHPSN